jgi:beta-glucanase (GH16 family)
LSYDQRKDILYGTFRTKAGVPSVPGVVFGFFTYITGTQEQDIEFLSADDDYYQHVHYTNQPGQTSGATLVHSSS